MSDNPQLPRRSLANQPLLIIASLAGLACAAYLAYSVPNWIGALLAALLGAPIGLIMAAPARLGRPARPAGDRPRQLVPAELSPPADLFVGRERELARMSEWATIIPRTISLYGPPGIGKSTVAAHFAIRVADEFPDGRLFGRPRLGADPSEAWKTILANFVDSLLDPDAERPGDPVELMTAFRQLTEDRAILVVLDDIDNAVRLTPLIPVGSRCLTVLVGRHAITSVPVGLTIELEPLDSRDSLTLLDHTMGDDRAVANVDAATTIVEKSDNLPLAVSLTGNALAGRPLWDLDLAVDLLNASVSEGTPGALDLLFGLLTEEEQQAFLRLGLLPAPAFSPWMLEAVGGAGSEAEARRTAGRLADVGLVERMPPDGAGIESYRMHDHVHEYARRRATADRDLDDVRDAVAGRLEQARRDRDERARTTDLNLQREVYRQKDEGDLDQALTTVLGAVTLTREAGQVPMHALALATLAELNTDLGRADVGVDLTEFSGAGDPQAVARVERCRALIARRHHQIGPALAAFDRALAVLGPPSVPADRERVRTFRERAVASALGPEPSSGFADIEAAEEVIARRADFEEQFRAGVEWARGIVFDRADRHADAAEALRRGLVAADAAGQRLWTAWLHHALARVAAELHSGPDCRHHADAALQLFGGMRHRYGIGHSRLMLGRADLLAEQPGTAAGRFEVTLETLTGCGDRHLVAETYLRLGEARRGEGRPDEARTLFLTAGDMFRALGVNDDAEMARRLADEPADESTQVTGTHG